MPQILHDFPIQAPIHTVFEAVSTPSGLDRWWTKSSSGIPASEATYELGFGPGFDWQARITRYEPDERLELEMLRADEDWRGTHVGFRLRQADRITQVKFHHTGWRGANAHYRISCYCWAMYLRVLRRALEHGEEVPYERRLEV